MEEITLKKFLEDLGDKTPAPGGGAVSALNGAIASAQLKMVCEYSKDKEVNEKTGFLGQKTKTFLKLAEDDSEAFLKVSEAYKSQDGEKIDSALTMAMKVSASVIANSEGLVLLCETNHQKFNPRLEADVITSLANLRAAVSSAQSMKKTNINAMKGEKPPDLLANVSYSDEILKRIDKLSEKIKAGK